jgi:hypothetical protein
MYHSILHAQNSSFKNKSKNWQWALMVHKLKYYWKCSKGVLLPLIPIAFVLYVRKEKKSLRLERSILPLNAHLDMNNKGTKHTVHIRSVNAHI